MPRRRAVGHRKCDRMGIRISSLVDGQLWEFEARGVRTHIEECPDCAAIYRELRSARLAARMLGQQEPPSDLWASVTDRLNDIDRRIIAMAQRRDSRRDRVRVGAVTGLILAALLGAILALRFIGRPAGAPILPFMHALAAVRALPGQSPPALSAYGRLFAPASGKPGAPIKPRFRKARGANEATGQETRTAGLTAGGASGPPG